MRGQGRASPPDDTETPLSAATTAELAWGFQDSVVDVLATKTARAAREVGAKLDRPGRRRGRERVPARAAGGRGRTTWACR